MYIDSAGVKDFTYINPDDGEFSCIDVVKPDPLRVGPVMAGEYQGVMYEAWTEQFKNLYTPDQIAETVSPPPKDVEDCYLPLVKAQWKRIQESNQPGRPVYVHAMVGTGSTVPALRTQRVVGIGKATLVDGRSTLSRLLTRQSRDNQLADVSNVFVRPSLIDQGHAVPVQNRGVGSAVLYSLLDAFPDDMRTVVYDYANNPRVTMLLTERLGFKDTKSWAVDMFGTQVVQTMFKGPTSGELADTLAAARPWLRGREPYTPPLA